MRTYKGEMSEVKVKGQLVTAPLRLSLISFIRCHRQTLLHAEIVFSVSLFYMKDFC